MCVFGNCALIGECRVREFLLEFSPNVKTHWKEHTKERIVIHIYADACTAAAADVAANRIEYQRATHSEQLGTRHRQRAARNTTGYYTACDNHTARILISLLLMRPRAWLSKKRFYVQAAAYHCRLRLTFSLMHACARLGNVNGIQLRVNTYNHALFARAFLARSSCADARNADKTVGESTMVSKFARCLQTNVDVKTPKRFEVGEY